MDRFDKLVISILGALAVAIAAVILSTHLIGLPLPELPGNNVADIGVNGPFQLQFATTMDTESVEERVTISPATSGTINWRGNLMEFWPDAALQAETVYTLVLNPGARSLDQREISQQVQLEFNVRRPRVTYLTPVLSDSEIWFYDGLLNSRTQISSSGGKMFDYNTHPDGRHIIYSYPNEVDGIDLWRLSTDTLQAEKVLDCGINWCIYPNVSPHGDYVAFSQRAKVDQDSPPGFPKIYILNLLDGSTKRLFDDPQITGFDASWSPDGSQLAFFDGSVSAIRVHNFQTNGTILLPSQMGRVGSWSPGGDRMVYTDIQFAGGVGKANVYIADLRAEDISQVLDIDPTLDFANPIWSPDGRWIASTAKYVTGGNDQQLVLIDADTYTIWWITQDSRFTHSSPFWSPSSDKLAYQRFELGSSQYVPEVWVFDLDSGTASLVSKDAGMPRWLP